MRYPNISDVKLGKDITTEVDTVFELLKKCIVKIEGASVAVSTTKCLVLTYEAPT